MKISRIVCLFFWLKNLYTAYALEAIAYILLEQYYTFVSGLD